MNNFPKLHNGVWGGLVGKGPDAEEPAISLDKMLDMTAMAEVGGTKFDGFDVFLYHPHFDIDGGDEAIKQLAEKARARKLKIGTVVAPIYKGTGGGSPIGATGERKAYVGQVIKACKVAQRLKELEVRSYGNVRIDTGINPEAWAQDPNTSMKLAVGTLREAAKVAADHGERIAAEGEICWGGMHSWQKMIDLLDAVDRPGVFEFMADMSHVLTFLLGIGAEEDKLLEPEFSGEQLDAAWERVSNALRDRTIDLHVSQSDGKTHGSGSHDATGKHCPPDHSDGKLNIPKHAGYWLRDAGGQLTKRIPHLCWDGCMFPNKVLKDLGTWNAVLLAMKRVREAHGWKA